MVEFINLYVLGSSESSISYYKKRSERAQTGHQYWYRKTSTHFQWRILKQCCITHIKHAVQINTSLDICAVANGPLSLYFHFEKRIS